MAKLTLLHKHLLVAFLLVLVGTLALWWLFSQRFAAVPWVLSYLGSVNLLTFGYYGWDKRQAVLGGWRIPELVLFVLAIIGGSPGALVAMWLFRHKTIKGEFRLVYWSIVAVQAALGLWIGKLLLLG